MTIHDCLTTLFPTIQSIKYNFRIVLYIVKCQPTNRLVTHKKSFNLNFKMKKKVKIGKFIKMIN